MQGQSLAVVPVYHDVNKCDKNNNTIAMTGNARTVTVSVNAIQGSNQELVRILLFITGEIIRVVPHSMKQMVRSERILHATEDLCKQEVHFACQARSAAVLFAGDAYCAAVDRKRTV